MPNQVKLDIVEKSTDRLKEASGIYLASYTGMSVIQATEFRKLCRETNVDYSITKNTLIKNVNILFPNPSITPASSLIEVFPNLDIITWS